MSIKQKTAWSIIIAATAVLIVGVLFGARSDERSYGDAVVVDRGMLSAYPRYIVTFRQVELAGGSNFVLKVGGLPGRELTLELVLKAKDTANQKVAKLGEEGAKLRVRIVDGEGEMMAIGEGPLTTWEHSKGMSGETLWHPALRHLRFERSKEYKIELELSSAGEDGRLEVTPVFRGGGHELP